MTELHAFYHCWCDGDWIDPVSEFFDSAEWSGLTDHLPCVNVGLVGSAENRQEVIRTLLSVSPIPVNIVAEADEGFEQVTLARLQAHMAVNDGYVLYCHTKGAFSDNNGLSAPWRRSMIHDLVACWRERVAELDSGYDAVGGHRIHPPHGGGYFGGNMWMARGEHIRRLPPLSYSSRYEAEIWIAQREDAKLLDVRPGWPGWGSFAKEALL